MTSVPDKSKLDELIEGWLLRINTAPDDVENLKEVTCPFYKDGGYSQCKGCAQADEVVLECTDDFKARILTRPMPVWSPEFYQIKKRARKKQDDMADVSLGQICDTCYLSEYCGEFEAGSSCAIDWEQDLSHMSAEKAMDKLIDLQSARVHRAKMIELVDGGIPDQNLSAEMDRLSGMLGAKHNMSREHFSFKMEMTGDAPPKESILQKLFGGGGKQEALPDVTTEFTDVEIIKNEQPVPVSRKRKT